MIAVAAVSVGNYLGQGRLYVDNLFKAVSRHLSMPWRGVCLTDDPSSLPEGIEPLAPPAMPPSWWHKLGLHQPGLFAPGERVVFLDLDTLILGSMDDIASYRGKFAIMSDVFHPEHCQSAVMCWEAGTTDHIWTIWDRGGRPSFDRRGDQAWVEQMMPGADRLQSLFPGQIVSYKADCFLRGRPDDARLCVFHGQPRIHDVDTPWVREAWNGSL